MKKSVRIVLAFLVLGFALMTTGCLGNPGSNLVGNWVGTYNGNQVVLEVFPEPMMVDYLVAKGYGYQAKLTVNIDLGSGNIQPVNYQFNASTEDYRGAINDALNAALSGTEMTPPNFPVLIWAELGVFNNIYKNQVAFYHPGYPAATPLIPPFVCTGTFEAESGFHLTILGQTVDLVPAP